MVRSSKTIELYTRRLSSLSRSPDPHLESLRWALTATDPEARRPADPDALETMVMGPSGNRETAYTALLREGFLYVDLDRIALRRFTPDEMDAYQELLSAYEAVSILRSRSMNLKQSRPALNARYEEFGASFAKDVLDAILCFQRLMLTVVAASASDKLMRMYASAACVSYAYAWAQRTEPAAIGNLREPVDEFYRLYMAGDQVAAARIISEIRAVGLGVGCLAEASKRSTNAAG